MSKNPSSLFIVLEGVDFSGKTTLLKKLKIFLNKDRDIKQYFQEIIYSKEPSENPIFCKKIRDICLSNQYKLSAKTSALSFFTNRSHHSETLLEPALKKPKTLVICDRFFLSTLVYQGTGDLENTKWLKQLQAYVTTLVPDITFFLQISYETFLKNMKRRISEQKSHLDERVNKSFKEMSDKYRRIINENPDISKRTIFLDSNQGTTPLLRLIKEEIIKQVKN